MMSIMLETGRNCPKECMTVDGKGITIHAGKRLENLKSMKTFYHRHC